MKTWWSQYSELGIDGDTPVLYQRSIILSNRIALVLGSLTLLLLFVLILLSGMNASTMRIGGSLLAYLGTPLLNHFRKYTLSRILISVVVPIYIIYLIGFNPQNQIGLVYTASYFPPRILTIATCIIPFLVFNTLLEKKVLTFVMLVSFTCAVGYDFLLMLLGKEVDIYNRNDLFIYYNVIFLLQFTTLTLTSFMLKRTVDRTDLLNDDLIEQKEKTNRSLHLQNSQLHQLHEEMTLQAEELKTNQEKLEEASTIIERQRNDLANQNKELEKIVVAKSTDLQNTNSELVKYNSELRQFSFTVSHNLRAPVARLLGLTYLLNEHEKEVVEPIREYINLIRQSSHELDVVIKDLNKIIDIRNEVYRIKEKVLLSEEWEKVISILKPMTHGKTQVTEKFTEVNELFTIRPILHNALYNLLSNALKYRSPERELEIVIASRSLQNYVEVSISDNGLGIDLEKHGDKLFGLYKRFHTHVEGKGMGLYLVKSQLESIGGHLEVSSKANEGTRFTLLFPQDSSIRKQIFYQDNHATISFNAVENFCTLEWHQVVESVVYKTIYLKGLEMQSIYNTPSWIINSAQLGMVSENELTWMFEHLAMQAFKNGLKKMALIVNPAKHTEPYLLAIQKRTESINITVKIFTSYTEAESWIKS